VAFGSDFAVRRDRYRAGELSVSLLPGPAPAAEPDPPAQGGDGQGTGPPPAAGGGTGMAPESSRRPVNHATPRLLARSARLDSRGRTAFSVRCTNAKARCAGALRLTVAGTWVGAGKFTVAPGARKTVRIRLTRRVRARLKARGRLKAVATLRVRTAGHRGVRQSRVTVTIRRAGAGG
jgi:hypothetical protein